MNRVFRKLVAVATLGAYFLLNTQLNIVLAYCVPPAIVASQAETENRPTGCSHCAKKAKAKNAPCSDSEKGNCPKSNEPGCPTCPNCPCDGKHCPIPGGCASCNPAKAPCLPPVCSFDGLDVSFDALDDSHSLTFLSPFLDDQGRPPRS